MNQPLLPPSSSSSSSSLSKQLWTRTPLSIEDGDSCVDYESVQYTQRPMMIVMGTYIGENNDAGRTSHSNSTQSLAQSNAKFESAKIANQLIDSNHYGWELTEEESRAKLRADLVATQEATSVRSKVLFGNSYDNPEEMAVVANQILPTQHVDTRQGIKTQSNNHEASGYIVSEYTTKEYVVSEYKSIYDS